MRNRNSFDFNHFHEELVFIILDKLGEKLKSFSQVCKLFHAIESRLRKALKPWRDDFLSIVSRYSQISHLDLSQADASLTAASSRYKETLKSITLTRCDFSFKGLKRVAVKCKNLVDIDLSENKITDTMLLAVRNAENLERLSLANCKRITDVGVGYVAEGCRKLRPLNLKGYTGVCDLGIAANFKELRSLDLSYLMITNNSLQEMLELQYLDHLVLKSCRIVWLNAIGNWCCSLKEVNLRNCKGVTGEGLSSIFTKNKDLQKVDITGCEKITCASIIHLTSSCPSLVSLMMGWCPQLSAEAFIAIGMHCQLLEELDVSSCEIDDEALKSIWRYPRLSSVVLRSCPKIGKEDSIKHLATSTSNLQVIYFGGSYRFTKSDVLAVLHDDPNLRKMNIAHRRCYDGFRVIARIKEQKRKIETQIYVVHQRCVGYVYGQKRRTNCIRRLSFRLQTTLILG